ncbi:hypothetical protein BDA99DRAFT_479157 [Phascolomyces articulosus]|uniref:Uncharacterized protein n=1 Tax=Phascolomyces articulosus TaxID=60185 RepID=A0AAD5PG73_9FUNG|nr:hypothetical protein BDA99DRAFT_479157 [Phascolomyces articulosus]
MARTRIALDLFLDSRIHESEAMLEPHMVKTSMYYSLAQSVLLTLKSMMTFEQEDFRVAIDALKVTIQLSNNLIRKSHGALWFLEGWAKPGLSVDRLQKMRPLYRHAELVHAEAYLIKAMICIIHDESIISFLREGLHVRQSYMTFTVLEKFINTTPDILDDHFTSGVKFGMGCFNLMLPMLPKIAEKLFQLIGFSGQRLHGLNLLKSCGGWDKYEKTGEMVKRQGPTEGIRRQFCDMTLICDHVVFANLLPMSDVNKELSSDILKYNLDLYPNGVFFLYFHGRQLFTSRELVQADAEYTRAIETQKDWVQLQHICYWDRGMIAILLQDWKTATEIYDILYKESNWSKSVYSYLRGMTMYMLSEQEQDPKTKKTLITRAMYAMKKVPTLKKRIAGRSIPLEKFVARKARRFLEQGNKLLFPDLEMANAFSSSDYMPVPQIRANMKRVDTELSHLNTADKYYADDLCACSYLRAMLARQLYSTIDDRKEMKKLRSLHQESLQVVFNSASDVQYEHFLYYLSHYEKARMMIVEKKYDTAEKAIQVVLKSNERNHRGVGAGPRAKHKYSMKYLIVFASQHCLTEIQELRKQDQGMGDDDNDSFASAL